MAGRPDSQRRSLGWVGLPVTHQQRADWCSLAAAEDHLGHWIEGVIAYFNATVAKSSRWTMNGKRLVT
jgi:hypothetical protein